MESAAYSEVADQIYGCRCMECPLQPRVGLPGYFPKFGGGGLADAVLAMITMNPGPPNDAQRRLTRITLSRREMHEQYDLGLRRYHREARGGAMDLPSVVRENAGLGWDQVYYTEVAKCVTTDADKADGTRSKALRICSARFLAKELQVIQRLRFAICFGDEVYRIVGEVFQGDPLLKEIVESGRLLKVPHPAAFGQRFRRELPAILQEVRAALSTAP